MVILEPMLEQQLPMEPTPSVLKRYLIIRRFVELMAWTVVLSIACILISYLNLENPQKILKVCLPLGALIFVLINVDMLKHCYYDLRKKYIYYLTNYIAYFLYMAVTALVYFLFGITVYSWAFGITRFLGYTFSAITNHASVIIFHVIMLVAIGIAPLGMDRIFIEEKEEEFLIPPLS